MLKNKKKITRKEPSIYDWGLRSRKYLLFVGGLNKREGAHYLIEAFKQLEDTAKTPNNFKLVIAANGEDDADYVKYVHTICEGRSNIVLLCVRKEIFIKQLLVHTYAYMQPTEIALASQNLLEIMRQGLCVVASDIAENKKILRDAGYIFKTKNVTDLRDKLAYLLNRPEEAKALGELAKKRIQMEYSLDLLTKKEVK